MQNLSPIAWALRPLKNYAKFSGRASRAEFWWFVLFMMIFYFVVWIGLFGIIGFSAAAAGGSPNQSPLAIFGALGVLGILVVLLWLVLLVPAIAVQVRRLHDTDRSGWWLGGFWLLYLLYMVAAFGTVFSSMAVQGNGSPPAPPNLGVFAVVGIIGLAEFVYSIVLLVFFCLRGTQGSNKHGEDPYGPDVERVFA
jgi:uncharacterized membrane protein YhaH (DUF805 family)